ncbi:hypothetical protein PAMP_002960 [Pampus punctatissimus]
MMLLEYFIFGLITFLVTGAQCEVTEVLAEAGSQVLLPCKCSSLSQFSPVIIWSKDNKGTVWRRQRSGLQYRGSKWSQRVQCPHSYFEKGDYSLQINSVREEDGGVYSCLVQHKDQSVENMVMLRVIKVSFSSVVPILGNSVTITCNVTPWPSGAHVQWKMNNSPFVPQTTSHRYTLQNVVKEKATLRLTGNWTCVVGYNGITAQASASLSEPWDKSASVKEVGFDDEGKYRCSGTIEGQRLTRNMQLVVAKVNPSKKKASVTLTCNLTDESEVTDYEWVHMTYDLNGTQSVGSIQKGKTLSISKVSDENWGEWTCHFYGKEGILGNVTYHLQLMSGLSGKKSSGPSHNNVMVAGLSILLLVLLMILAQMCKNHQRRKRIFQYPALEAIVHTISNEREEIERNRMRK